MELKQVTLAQICEWNATRVVRSMRTRNIRKMVKPYTGRDVVFTCSNGWTIEKLVKADFPVEGFFMGHCLGSDRDHYADTGFYSLREPDGTPHVTIRHTGVNIELYGRANKFPCDEYVALAKEWGKQVQKPYGWGADPDTDVEYHTRKLWNDMDYRDHARGAQFRGATYKTKRGV